MKSLLFIVVCLAAATSFGQDKSQLPSPPAKVSETTARGVTVTINYSQPSVKGRTIGKNLEPMPGKVWRTGANEATIFEVDKNVNVEGKALPAGKYGLFTLVDGDDWTIIFNKTWSQWGAFTYKDADDALRVKVKAIKAPSFMEKMTFTLSKDGKVSLFWGDMEVDFTVN